MRVELAILHEKDERVTSNLKRIIQLLREEVDHLRSMLKLRELNTTHFVRAKYGKQYHIALSPLKGYRGYTLIPTWVVKEIGGTTMMPHIYVIRGIAWRN